MKKSNAIMVCAVSALFLGMGTFLSHNGYTGQSRALAAEGGAAHAARAGSAQISPEIKDLLQKNNLRPAQYQTPAPDFTLRDLDGRTVRLSQFRGETVLLGFFTTW